MRRALVWRNVRHGMEAAALRAGFREEEVGWVDSRHSMARKKFTDSGDPGGLIKRGSRSLWLLDLGWIKP